MFSQNFSQNQTDKFVFLSWQSRNTWNLKLKFKFQVLPSRQDRKTNLSVHFLGEVTAQQFCFEIYWPLKEANYTINLNLYDWCADIQPNWTKLKKNQSSVEMKKKQISHCVRDWHTGWMMGKKQLPPMYCVCFSIYYKFPGFHMKYLE